jgi:hypothetical protein
MTQTVTAISGQFLAAQKLAGQTLDTLVPGGVPSAQSFGAVYAWTPQPQYAPVTGLVSAQAFGAVGTRQTLGGVSSAAAFGAVDAHASIVVPVQGFDPWFYTATIVGQTISGQKLCGGAYAYGDPFGNIRILQSFALGGVASAQAFGAVRPLNILRLVGISSAQTFGPLTILVGPVFIPAQGLASAQAFGATWAYKVWLRDLICSDIILAQDVCTDLALVPADEQTVALEQVVC